MHYRPMDCVYIFSIYLHECCKYNIYAIYCTLILYHLSMVIMKQLHDISNSMFDLNHIIGLCLSMSANRKCSRRPDVDW